jgi:hypothetical protein
LLDNGWSAGNGNPAGEMAVQWMTTANEFEYRRYSRHALPAALRHLEEIEARGEQFYFDISWPEDRTVITACNDLQGKVVPFRLQLADHHALNGLEPLLDHSWYTPKILIPLRLAGCVIDGVEWLEEPTP